MDDVEIPNIVVKNTRRVEMPEELKKGAEELKALEDPRTFIFDKCSLTATGSIKSKSRVNVVIILADDSKLKGLFGFNEFTENIEVVKDIPELNIYKGGFRDSYLGSLSIYIEKKYRVVFTNEFLTTGIKEIAVRNSYNPIKNLIECEEWDKRPRAATLFIDYLGAADTKVNREIAKKWLVGAVARVYQPGIKFELMPVLIGSQGIGKSTLCGKLSKDYFLDNLPGLSNINKDNQMLIKDNWIIEIAELSAMTRSAVESTKAFVSTQVDKYKAPYGSVIEEHPRRCVFIGTTNEYDFLKDKTGNRRFIPVVCGQNKPLKDVFSLGDDTIKQLWAEALYYYNQGEKLFFDRAVSDELVAVQSEHTQVDDVEAVIDEYLNMPVPLNWNDEKTTIKRAAFRTYRVNGSYKNVVPFADKFYQMREVATKEIAQVVFDLSPSDMIRTPRSVSKKITTIMDNKPGFIRSNNIKINGKNNRGYIRVNN